VRNAPTRLARYTSDAAATNQQLKRVLRAHVYNSEMVVEERRCSTARVAELFDYLLDHPEAMPSDYRSIRRTCRGTAWCATISQG
jgi:dGTP triphosphohydrolase